MQNVSSFVLVGGLLLASAAASPRETVTKGSGKTCYADGRPGMDVLKRCLLVVSRGLFADGRRP